MAIRTPTVLSICTGAGGLDLGFRLAHPDARTVCYVEREAFPVVKLVAATEANLLDAVPLWDDLRTFDGSSWRGVVDWLIGGIPCQAYSRAGKRKGATDERNLWPDARRVIAECRPDAVFLENVSGIARYYFDSIRPGLRGLGYRVEEGLFSAEEVGAPHIRERLFVLGYADRAVLDFAKRGVEGYPPREGRRIEGGLGASVPGDQLETAIEHLAQPVGDGRRRRHDSRSGRGPVADDQLVSAGSGSPLADGGGWRREREDGVRQGQSELDQRDADVAHGNGNGRAKAPHQHRNGDPSLPSLAKMWPTATASRGAWAYSWADPERPSMKLDGAARAFPTASASDAKGFDGPGKARPRKNWGAYSHLVRMTLNRGHECSPKCRRLNPLFVAWLMGWPGGWTLLPSGRNDYESLATEWYRWSRLMRYSLSRLGH